MLKRGQSLAAITAKAVEEFPGGATVERVTLAGLVLAHSAGVTVPPVLLRQAKRFTDARLRKEAATSAAAAARRAAAQARVVARKAAARDRREALKVAQRVAKAAATRAAKAAALKVSRGQTEGRGAVEVAAQLFLQESLPVDCSASCDSDTAAPWD